MVESLAMNSNNDDINRNYFKSNSYNGLFNLPSSSSYNNHTYNNKNNDNNKLSEFEKLNIELKSNPELINDLNIGKRIGYFAIGYELGSGNFSQVKLGTHMLTRGMLI